MKILSIRLKNLASLSGEHFIDFETEPLANAGLIAIIGKTGAGKSTILDAMCLALFNKIPRLKDSDGKLLDVDGSELLTNSPLTVLRRGTGHGFAELCFVAQDQKHYLARWEIKRARENANGKLQSVQRSLKCLTDGVVIADKTKAVDTHIQQITQLSFEQFTRAVLLAQSEVTAFLKARDNERGELLEYLTNSSIFAKIGQLAFEKTREIANQRKQLEHVLGHIELLSDDEITELHKQRDTTQSTVQKLELEKGQLQQHQQWFERKHKLEHEILLKQQQLDQQQQAHEALNMDRELLSQLEVFSEIRPQVVQQQQQLQQQLQLAPQIEQKQAHFSDLSIQFEQQRNRYLHAENQLEQIQHFEQQYQPELTQLRTYIQKRDYIAEEYTKTKNKLGQAAQQQSPLLTEKNQLESQRQRLLQEQQNCTQQLEQSTQFAPLDQGLNAHLQQLHQFIQQYQKIENVLGNLQTAQVQLQQDQTLFNDLLETFGTSPQIEARLEQKQQFKEQQLTLLNQLATLQHTLNLHRETQQELQDLQPKRQQLEQTHSTLQQHNQAAEQDYYNAKTEREKLQQILQQQRLLHAENIEHLRADLKPGEPCLVCGSIEHPYREDEHLVSRALYELQQQQEQQATQKEQQAFALWQATQQQLTRLQAEQTQLQQTCQQYQQKVEQQQQEFINCLEQVDITLDTTLTLPELSLQVQQRIHQTQQHKQHVEQELQTLQQAHKQQRQLEQQIQQLGHQLGTAQQLQHHIQHIVDCLDEEKKRQWSQDPLQESTGLLHLLQQRAEQLVQVEALSKQLDQTQQQSHVLNTQLEHAVRQQHELTRQLQEIEAQGRQNTADAQALINTISPQTELKATEWLQQHDQNRQHCQQHYQQNKQQFEQSRDQFEQHKQALQQLTIQQQHNQKSLEQCQTEIDHWLKQHPDFNAEQFHALQAVSTAQQQQIRVILQQAERLLNEAMAALRTCQEQLRDHNGQQPDIDHEQLQSRLHHVQEQLQQMIELRDQYKLKLQVQQQNLTRQQQYADQIQQIQQQEHRWSKISSLIGDAKGKDFRDYAQQYHLDILLEYANQQLTLLSQRYTLKRLENSLSLAIIDHDMDGETRAVASLSGGESFLTALAISLAIANMASGSMKIESLFIDEGFGTLDASSLHMVMNALDQLQSQGRKVVLISHIQEMHERIPVQIQVQPLGSGSSRIEIVG